jgi:hypothetical protein
MKRHIEGVFWSLSVGILLIANFVSSRPFGLVLAVTWVVCTMIVIPLHFYRAWRRFTHVSNRREYATWVGFETAATAVLLFVGIYSVVSR